MLSITCPKCGRRGSIPPDRLSSRLHCRACDAVIYMDRTGQLAVDESAREADAEIDDEESDSSLLTGKFRLAEAWEEIPAGLKMALPIVIVAGLLIAWVARQSFTETEIVAHSKVGEAVLRAVVANDREKVMALADPPTAEDAGLWFDRVRARFESQAFGQDVFIYTTPIEGNVEKDARVVLAGTLASRVSEDEPPMLTDVCIRRDGSGSGSGWIFDGTETLKAEEADSATRDQSTAASTTTPAPAPAKTPGNAPAPNAPAAALPATATGKAP